MRATLPILLCAGLALIPAAAGAATIEVSAPGILSESGATYVLTRDITADGTAFVIHGNDITFDLNGHTITYGNAPGDYRYGVVIPPSYARAEFPGVAPRPGSGGNRCRITNGAVIQGAGNGARSTAVFVWGESGGRDAQVDNLRVVVHGPDTRGINTKWSSGEYLHHNQVENNSTVVSNRHEGMDAILVEACYGNVRVQHNIIRASPQFGIRVSAPATRGFIISDNDIRTRGITTNPYAIAIVNRVRDFVVRNNTIVQANGRGILVDGYALTADGPAYGRIHDNHIEVREGPNAEYGAPGQTTGFKIRFGSHDLEIDHNTVVAYAGTDVPFAGDTSKAWAIFVGAPLPYGGNIYVHDNEFTATTNDPRYAAEAVALGGASEGEGVVFANNVIRSNWANIALSCSDGYAHNGTFVSNRLVRLGTLEAYRPVVVGWWTLAARNHRLLDMRFEGGSYADVAFAPQGTDLEILVGWLLDVAVQDGQGAPIGGATVTITDAAGTVAFTGATDSAGRIPQQTLIQYRQTTPTQKQYLAPYTIAVSAAGFPLRSVTTALERSEQLTVTLAAASAVSISKTADRANASPGETVTYTITASNSTGQAAHNVVITDQIPANCTYTSGSARLNGNPVSPDPYSGGTLAVNVGRLDPGASAVLTFQVRVN